MAECENCIHKKVCSHRANIQTDTYAYMGIKYDTEKCEYYTADVVEVVRCKDCIHARNMPLGLCYLHTEPYDNAKGYKGDAVCVEPNDYCSYGERRE